MTDPLYVHHPEVVATLLPGDEVVLLRLDTQQYVSLNETGGAIWDAFAAPASVQAAADALVAAYDVDAQTAQDSVRQVVDQLCTDGLLIASPDVPSPDAR